MAAISLKNAMQSMAMVAVLGVAMATWSSTARAETPFTAKVKAAMTELKSETEKLGAPKETGGTLFFGSTKINDNFAIVDEVKAHQGGATATLFVKKDSSFIRVSTNVMKEGKRAVGTQLDPSGPAMAALRQGNAYYGIVDILGKLYDTGYEPIKTAKGEVVGVYYVGYSME